MRNFFKLATCFAVAVLLVALVVPLLPGTGAAAMPDLTSIADNLTLPLMLVGAIGAPINPVLTRGQLEAIADPVEANQGEAIQGFIFDTQTFVSAAANTLRFFGAAQADRSLSNMQNGGQLPDPQFFRIYHMGLDVLLDASAPLTTELGALDDIQKLLWIARGFFTLEVADKKYCEGAPISVLHTSGGATGVFATATTVAATTSGGQVANNSIPDGGWNQYGCIVIPSKQNFVLTMEFGANVTLNNGNTLLRVWFAGHRYRRVL